MVFIRVLFTAGIAVVLSGFGGNPDDLRERQGGLRSQQRVRQILDRLEMVRSPREVSGRDTLWSEIGKCGFRASFEVTGIWEQLNPEQQARVLVLLQPPQRQKDTIIGLFRIHFDTTGFHEPALLDDSNQRIPGTSRQYVDSVGRVFNEVYSNEVDALGYASPPYIPGETRYDVYITDLGSNLYGQTLFFPDSPIQPGAVPPRYTSYVEIHHDFRPFFSKGIKGLKVTAAHEFHHVIQVGSYGWWDNSLFFYEVTSTWMEDVLYNDINDYYQYIRSTGGLPLGHFSASRRSLNATGNLIEYSRAVWAHYLAKRFGPVIMSRIWQQMRQESSLPAMDYVLGTVGSNLRDAYGEFSLWNQFTGRRADSVLYYPEAWSYPEIRLEDTLRFQRPLSVFSPSTGLESLGAAYFAVMLDTREAISIIMKNNIAEAGDGRSERFQYLLRSDGGDDSFSQIQLDGAIYWAKIGGVRNPTDWMLVHATDSFVVKPFVSDMVVYPNPFYPGIHSWIRFEIPGTRGVDGILYIFTSGMELAYTRKHTISFTPLRHPYITWNGRGSNGDIPATGIYFYTVELEDRQFVGKFSLIRKQ